jgi:hypothetical protein
MKIQNKFVNKSPIKMEYLIKLFMFGSHPNLNLYYFEQLGTKLTIAYVFYLLEKLIATARVNH